MDVRSWFAILLLTQEVGEKTEGVIMKQFLFSQGRMPLPLNVLGRN
jgi:hypothetical protein